MILISSFTKAWGDPRAVSIAGAAPSGWPGKELKKLAPRLWFYLKYKEDGDSSFYTEHYHKEVLSRFDPLVLGQELEGSILCCYEEEGFCHRFLVQEWLQAAGFQVEIF
jgi:hypothetical protein